MSALNCPKCGSTNIEGVESLFCKLCGKAWERPIVHADEETMRAAQGISDAVAGSVAEKVSTPPPNMMTPSDLAVSWRDDQTACDYVSFAKETKEKTIAEYLEEQRIAAEKEPWRARFLDWVPISDLVAVAKMDNGGIQTIWEFTKLISHENEGTFERLAVLMTPDANELCTLYQLLTTNYADTAPEAVKKQAARAKKWVSDFIERDSAKLCAMYEGRTEVDVILGYDRFATGSPYVTIKMR